ncbi:sensor domain-containing diguanylate cyclase [Virgibacillus sp. LDC1]|nr:MULTISPECIES: sensor domain-containing diguanylate cyclase [Paenibacillus]MCV4229948.1 sensor domain-containing diguanylate cyclase [Virgibacillus sp. LDC1]MDL1163760.1 sensor domain-containing diguanylate cyclase [Yersinia pestis]MEC0255226.1 sensor domain-containing diguanylate cyclase [Paenibacillus lautus]PJN53751.1 putative diguanylate cyclase YdaM [Paenibacillus sp. GM2FR]
MNIPKKRIKISLAMVMPALVSLSILMTMSIMIYIQYKNEKRSLYNNTMSLNLSSAQKMAVTIEALLSGMRQSLRASANNPAIEASAASDEKELQVIFDLMLQSSLYFNSVFWADQAGTIRVVSPEGNHLNPARLITEGTTKALNERKSYISAPYRSPTGRWMILASEPIFDSSGKYHGMIAGTIYLEENNILHRIFGSGAGNEKDSYSYIVDSGGKLLYHLDKSRVGEDVSSNVVVQRLMDGESGMQRVMNTQGNDYLTGYASVSMNGWGIVMQTSVSSILDDVNRNLQDQLRSMLLPIMIMLVIAAYMATRIAAPFTQLYKLTKSIAAGQTVSSEEFQPHWNREADQLNQIMGAAAETLAKQAYSLQQEASTDPLTGLTNRRELERCLDSWDSLGDPYAVLMLDIDHFKNVNDTYGHQTGDQVLKLVAAVMSGCVPAGAVCSRFGGEEFVILLRKHSMEEAYRMAERIRNAILISQTPYSLTLTVSIGVSLYPEHGGNREDVFQAADMALYRAKDEGRNRTIAAGLSA